MARKLKTSTLLKRAKAHIADPANFARGRFAQRRNGHIQTCALGACALVLEPRIAELKGPALDATARAIIFGTYEKPGVREQAVEMRNRLDNCARNLTNHCVSGIMSLNDGCERAKAHDQVLQAFDCAIAKAAAAEREARKAAE